MPQIIAIKPGLGGGTHRVPTDSVATVLPMTANRIGREVEDEDELPVRVQSAQEAFELFKPSIHIVTRAGKDETEFVVDFDFRNMDDFHPSSVLTRIPGKQNDLADLKGAIDLLYRLKDRWTLPPVKKAWSDPGLRKQILEALGQLRLCMARLADAKGGI